MSDQDGLDPANPLKALFALQTDNEPTGEPTGLRSAEELGYAYNLFSKRNGSMPSLSPSARQALKSTVESEFIPRLMLSHSVPSSLSDTGASDGALAPGPISVADEDVAVFNRLILDDADAEARGFVDLLIARGIPQEAIYTDLFAVCARRLGEMWEADLCSFAEVTLGLCRLHELLRAQGSTYDINFIGHGDRPSILLGTLDTDTHIFGIAIVAEFFRRAQWRVQCAPGSDCEELIEYLGGQDVDVLGLSLSGVTSEKALKKQISHLREGARNPNLRIIVGGPQLVDDPELFTRIGADDGSTNARTAPSRAASLVAATIRHS
ncbi:MAG: cobalamin-dependent protein [Pseudomonadota bacterium]